MTREEILEKMIEAIPSVMAGRPVCTVDSLVKDLRTSGIVPDGLFRRAADRIEELEYALVKMVDAFACGGHMGYNKEAVDTARKLLGMDPGHAASPE